MGNPQRAWHHPLHISDPTLCLITYSRGQVWKIICICGRINKTDHITILFYISWWRSEIRASLLPDDCDNRPQGHSQCSKMGLHKPTVTGSDRHQSSPTSCNCCWIKQRQAFTRGHFGSCLLVTVFQWPVTEKEDLLLKMLTKYNTNLNFSHQFAPFYQLAASISQWQNIKMKITMERVHQKIQTKM